MQNVPILSTFIKLPFVIKIFEFLYFGVAVYDRVYYSDDNYKLTHISVNAYRSCLFVCLFVSLFVCVDAYVDVNRHCWHRVLSIDEYGDSDLKLRSL